jgi:calcineurin-like phosphoesterase family protein
MTIYFTADLHTDHSRIIEYCSRPFTSVSHMQEELIRRHNERVKPDDIVYDLGDFSMSEKTVPLFLPRYNGLRHLIMGNHDFCHPCKSKKKNYEGAIERYLSYGFKSVSLEMDLEEFHLHHMPYTADERHGERYSKYRPKRTDDKWLLHGHTHTLAKFGNKELNVGVDQWNYYPVSIDEVRQAIKEYEDAQKA